MKASTCVLGVVVEIVDNDEVEEASTFVREVRETKEGEAVGDCLLSRFRIVMTL